MFMSDRLYKSDLTPLEKLVLCYAMRGNFRQKYIALQTFAKELYQSEPTISKAIKSLEKKDLLRWVKVSDNKYKILIITQKAFNKYGYITSAKDINEKQLTKDTIINSIAEIEAQKDLFIMPKKKEKVIKQVPSWYNDYKDGKFDKKAPPQEDFETKELLKNLFN